MGYHYLFADASQAGADASHGVHIFGGVAFKLHFNLLD